MSPPASLRLRLRLIAGAIAILAATASAQAAESAPMYPTKPIRLVVPYAAGGATDVVAREIVQRLSETLHQSVVLDNRPGAGSVIGHNVAAKAPPDGYTLLLGTSAGLVINPLLTLQMPYDAARDLAPISMLVISPQVLVLHPQVPANSVRELVALAQARPGRLNYASPGPGSPNHLGGELLKAMAVIDMVHVPYKGGGPAITDLIAGQVQLLFNSIPPVLPHMKSGRLKAIAVGSAKRAASLPDLPTVAETLPGFLCVTWYALLAPAGTPLAIVEKLNTEIVRMLAAPDIRQRLAAQGVEAGASTPGQVTTLMREEYERLKNVVSTLRVE
jgi:tripartite-type tricarboxylate transporter receptor subunit TctC